MTYSTDPEVQFYAVDVLWWRAYRGLEPSRECIAAFCAALKAGDARTRLSALQGLSALPVWPEALPALQLALKDPEEEIRVGAAAAILKLKPDCDLQRIFQTGLISSNHNARVISEVELSNLRRRQETRFSESTAKP
jgi:HEAT repeat protein